MSMDEIKQKLKEWSKRGMHWPFVHDPTSEQPSVTLMFFYISFVIAALIVGASSIASLIKGDYLTATFMPITMYVLGFVFYRLRRLDSFKIDLDDKSIELDGGEDKKDE